MYRLALLGLVVVATPAAAEPPGFTLAFDAKALDTPFTGRVFVMVLRNDPFGLAPGFNWFNPEPTFALDVKDWKPGELLRVGPKAMAYPTPLADLKPGKYWVQAVMDRDLGDLRVTTSPGNVYSKAVPVNFDPKSGVPIALTLDRVYAAARFPETDEVRLAEVESKLLTAFHDRPTKLRAGVILPPSYDKHLGRKYPVVYEIPGFSGNHRSAPTTARRKPGDLGKGAEVIWVVLDPGCRLGHSVFADSANNGPWGQALTEELIPYIEKTYRGAGEPAGRFVTGHSSGGWSSLWLQVAYPDVFGGCWSTSPDPVDFRDFQRVNVYAPGANLFTDEAGKPRPLSRAGTGGTPILFRGFSDMEVVMGRGGQLFSFEAVFSPKGADGKPKPLWDRKTGAIDPEVAKEWEKYDIRLVLERNWKTLGPKLAGKVNVWMGDEDTFYLDGAARLLKKSLADLKSDAVVEMFPKKTHNLVDAALRKRMNEEMAAAVRKWDKSGDR